MPDDPTADTATDVQRVRELILASHRDIVPELIGGESITDLMESIEPARAAFSRIATEQRISVPAGGNDPVLLPADDLPTAEKIRRGLAATQRPNRP